MSNPNDLPLYWFMDQQYAKLIEAKNVVKPHWLEMGLMELHRRVCDEADELELELSQDPVDPVAVIRECVDVANFVAMIAHQMKIKLEERLSG